MPTNRPYTDEAGRDAPTSSVPVRSMARTLTVLIYALSCLGPQEIHAEQLFRIRRPTIELQMIYEDEEEQQSTPFSGSDQHTTVFRPRLDITTDGWIYEPDLFKFAIGLQPESKREVSEAEGGFDRTVDSTFLGYFLDATILQAKPYTFRLFTSQSRDEFDSSLSADSVTKSRVTRATLLLHDIKVPTKITYENRDVDYENMFSFNDASEIIRVQAEHQTEVSRTAIRSEYLRQDRKTNASGFTIDRWDASLTNRYEFQQKSHLFSSVSAIDSSSELFDTRIFALAERVNLQHRPKLRSHYDARFDRREEGDFTSSAFDVAAGVAHQLYDNLSTSFDLRADDNRFTDGRIKLYASEFDLHYKREIPWGSVELDNGYEYRLEDNDIDAVSTEVLSESHVLIGSVPVFLDNFNVDIASIVVTNLTVTIIYQEGFDYVVNRVGDAVTIERAAFGLIADGEGVLVSYSFVPNLPFEFSRTTIRYGTALNLGRAARIFYQGRRVTEDLKSGTEPAGLGNSTEQRAGGEVRWKWSKTRVDYEDRDSIRTPLSRWRVQESVSFRMGDRWSAGGSLSYSETDLKEGNEATTDRGVLGNIRWRIAGWGDLEVKALSRELVGSSQDSISQGITAQLRWRYGAWRGIVRYEDLSDSDDITGLTRDRRRASLQVSRRFR